MLYIKIYIKLALILLTVFFLKVVGRFPDEGFPALFFIVSVPFFYSQFASFFKEASNVDRAFLLTTILLLTINLIYLFIVEDITIKDYFFERSSADNFFTLILPCLFILLSWKFFKIYKRFEK